MHIVLVQVHVKPEFVESFIAATKDNASNSILEPGVVRFDFIQEADDSTRFILVEVYKSAEDQLKHRESRHYLTWKEAVTDMMAEPRIGTRFRNILPEDKDWKK
ncbi:MAG TPA: antibiotic biosynthesis monooxygenase [Anaerolineaceae bacterium]|nr:antibiotic biosynthesis monooxygenase [Anaerolineaceae bacterium]